MVSGGKTLVMAGAREAHSLVAKLQVRGRDLIAFLPEAERMFAPLPVPTRTGDFEDAAALEAWFEAQNVTCVIDASHAFDAEVSRRAASVCSDRHIRYLRVLRPAWQTSGHDVWTHYRSLRAAAEDVPPGGRVFSNTGRASLPAFDGFRGQILFLRQNQPHPDLPPYDFVTFVTGRPPYLQHEEEALFRSLRVSRLICRNVGGTASISKLLAARRLGIRVSMIERPATPVGMPVVETVTEALAWEADG